MNTKTEQAKVQAQFTPGSDQIPLMADGPIVFIKSSAGLGQKVAMCQRGDYVSDVDREFAAFICRAVNSHADLLAALHECLDAFDAEQKLQAGRGESVAVDIGMAAGKARAAIARAEGKV